MRSIERSSTFKKDYKRIKKTPRYKAEVDALLVEVVECLVSNRPLPQVYLDHPLSGDWKGYRDCHLKPDLLLIYNCDHAGVLRLARLGSHSDIFG